MTSLDQSAAPAATAGSSLLFSRTVSVSEAIAQALEDAGIDLVMGVVAGHTTPIFEALYRHPSIRTIQVRQELLGSLAANAYGRLTGRPAVISGEGEFILGTGTQGIIESLLGSAPMLILTEMFDGGRMSHHGNYHSGAGDQANYDAVAAYKAICKKVFVSHYPAQAVQHTQLAVKHALAGDPGPVAVIYHSAAFEGDVGPDSFPRIYHAAGYIKDLPKSVDPAAIQGAADTIQSAERPVIIAGNGVRMSQAYESLRAFAYAADAPVVTTQGGKGTYPETDALAGGVFGEWGRESANALVSEADLILAVGTKLGPLEHRRPDPVPDRPGPPDPDPDRHRPAEQRVDAARSAPAARRRRRRARRPGPGLPGYRERTRGGRDRPDRRRDPAVRPAVDARPHLGRVPAAARAAGVPDPGALARGRHHHH